ncbi:hypothetical protein GALMADRAFT_139451 [Galerina marginata CBS 339.88]|uniref:NACHT domain-containing protein n=1 Tax=Galerina marginata (strain CBS 339.88) TaxID=685588 RepID=A0A067TC28_GALM3|nr:hypothetical protein GALMADRAFT_139451 [Galerina marginata CBS 339.88]
MFSKPRQVSVLGGNFLAVQGDYNYVQKRSRPGIEILFDNIAQGALHDSGERFDPPKCHPNTRKAVLKLIMEWIEYQNPSSPDFISVTGRNHNKRLVATIAYQIALSFPEVKALIEKAVDCDPALLSRNLDTQLKTLVIEPLLSLDFHTLLRPRIIIIDGLDDRTEYHIREAFNDKNFATSLYRIALDNTLWRADEDIREFLTSEFEKIRDTHQMRFYIPQVWPPPEAIDELVAKSSGQFIYASTVIKYIEAHGHHPTNRLDTIRGLRSIDNGTPFAELDDLYRHILSTVDNYSLVSRILGYLLQATTIPFTLNSSGFLDRFFLLQAGTTYLSLGNLHSIMMIADPDDDSPITMIHASFGDFLLDHSRSGIYCLEPSLVNADLAVCFLQHIAAKDRNSTTYLYSVAALMEYCSRASPTTKLLESLSSFDLVQWITAALRWIPGIANGFKYFPRYCDWLSSQTDLVAQDVLKRHVKIFDQCLLSEIHEHGYTKEMIWYYIVVKGIEPLGSWSTWTGEQRNVPGGNFFQHGLDDTKVFRDYMDFLRQFFYDNDRAGAYVMSDDTHVDITLWMLEQLRLGSIRCVFHQTSGLWYSIPPHHQASELKTFPPQSFFPLCL